MTAENLDHDFAEMILREHRELKELLARARTAICEDQRDSQRAKQLIGDLYEHLQSHFFHEEEGGYMCEALERAPRLIRQAEELHEQHETLAEMLGELRDFVQHVGPADARPRNDWWKELARRFQTFGKQLLRHEADEDDLVQEAFTRDVGTCD
jgi:hemerythrin